MVSAEATSQTIRETLYDLVEDIAHGGGDRLYLYYAGHGLASRVNQYDDDAIVPSATGGVTPRRQRQQRPQLPQAIPVYGAVPFLRLLPRFPEPEAIVPQPVKSPPKKLGPKN